LCGSSPFFSEPERLRIPYCFGPASIAATHKHRHLASAHQSSVPSTEEDHDDAFDRENEVRANDQNISSGVNNDQDDEEPGWVFSSGDLQKELKPVPQPEKDPRSQWDFRIGKNGVIEHFRTQDGRVAVRETEDKIQILDQDHDSLALALERALERFGSHLHSSMGTRLELELWLILWSRMICA
jgi:hypothetical protein